MSASERPTMRPFRALAPFADARAAVAELGQPIARSETLALEDAVDRVLAAEVRAAVDVPNADRAAMDGFALRARDAVGTSPLQLVGRTAAGQPGDVGIEPGECLEIATGAPLPAGADAVIPVERTRRDDQRVTIDGTISPGDNISRRAEDLGVDTVVADAGTRLQPSLIAACAAAGAGQVQVYCRPRVRLVSTGDEVVPLGSGPLAPGQVYDSNAQALSALLHQAGADVLRTPILRDEREQLDATLRQPDADLVVTIGGTSVGRRDLISDAVAELGEVLVHGVQARPGKPLLLARLPEAPLVGLPGFPTSCLTMAYLTALPLTRRLARLPHRPTTVTAELDRDVESPAGKTHFLPVRLDGEICTPTFTFSSAVSSMASADGWIEIAPGTEAVQAGTRCEVTLY